MTCTVFLKSRSKAIYLLPSDTNNLCHGDTDMHKPEKQSCAYLEGEKNMHYMRFFFSHPKTGTTRFTIA